MNKQDLDSNSDQEQTQDRGKTTVAPDVLITIARLTTMDVSGVSRMGHTHKGANRLFSRSVGEGVHLEIKNDSVFIDLHVILKYGVNIRDVSRLIQQRVNRSISEMVGMQVGRVNIHIDDIDFPGDLEPD